MFNAFYFLKIYGISIPQGDYDYGSTVSSVINPP